MQLLAPARLMWSQGCSHAVGTRLRSKTAGFPCPVCLQQGILFKNQKIPAKGAGPGDGVAESAGKDVLAVPG